MKNLTTISLFIFWAVVTATMVAGLVFYQDKQNVVNPGVAKQESPVGVVLSINEIAKHNTIDSCWMLIGGKVYDVTNYFGSHPGGTSTMAPSCGKDATAAFATKDPYATSAQGSSHSSSAQSLLANYYIGDLNKPAVSNVAMQNTSTTTKKTTQTSDKPIIPSAQVALTLQEIAKHNKAGDCWMLISGKVYNVTNYFGSHPGGNSNLAAVCGKDATAAYLTKDPNATSAQGAAHSAGATSLLANYYIGDLNQTIGQQKIQQTSTVTPPPTSNYGEDDDD